MLSITVSAAPQTFSADKIDTLARYIISLQYKDSDLASFGAIRKSKLADAIVNGQDYFAVVPYFSHIGCIGLLRSGNAEKTTTVKNWMKWYLKHVNAKGHVLNHYYKTDGTGETTCLNPEAFCNYIDAEDSNPAMFWTLAYEYYLATNDVSFFTPAVKIKMEAAAGFLIDSLVMPDNLSIAKRSYPIKFTMDNSEVYKGLLSLSEIEKGIYGDVKRYIGYRIKANDVRNAVRTLLFNSNTGLYHHYLGGAIDSTKWYSGNGITATLWPQLFEVDDPDDARSVEQRRVLNNNFDGTPNADWTKPSFLGSVDPFTWASVGYVFTLAGDTTRGYAQASYISSIFVSPFNNPACYVADAGWAIMNMATKFSGSIVYNKSSGDVKFAYLKEHRKSK